MTRINASILLALAAPALVYSNAFSLSVAKKSCSGWTLPPRAHGSAQAPEVNEQNFWFANFTVGAKCNLEMLIDTGSADVYLNPGHYIPGKKSVDTHRNFSISFATTNPDGSGTETIRGPIYKDLVSLDGTTLSVAQQYLGEVAYVSNPPAFPNDGLVGFAGLDSSALRANPWFASLCAQGSLLSCRFGLAFKTDSTGVQTFGRVDTSAFHGSLSVAPISDQWTLNGDIAVNGKVIERDATIVTDSGTTVIFGPIDSVKKMFDAAGIQSFTHAGNGADVPTTLNGYFPCNKPPKMGFGFPSLSDAEQASENVSSKSTIFNVVPSQLVESSNSGNCTVVIHGTDQFDIWLVGQAFFQGRYIDHNVDEGTMGFANLVGYQA